MSYCCPRASRSRSAQARRDGWFQTDDRVKRDADGFHRFVNRIKDAIRHGGETSAWEVEEVRIDHPTVSALEASTDLGEDEVMIFIVPGGEQLNPVQLVEWMRTAPRTRYVASTWDRERTTR